MKFRGLDGKIHAVDPYRKQVRSFKSLGQETLGQRLNNILPGYSILEEFVCPGTGGLRLDFFLPALKLAFEFDGRQHGEYVPRFHGDRRGFVRSQANDARKEEWCELNDIKLYRVKQEDLDGNHLEEIIRAAP